jgi:hypothetical protein
MSFSEIYEVNTDGALNVYRYSPGTEDNGYGYAAATSLSSSAAVLNADSYALYANGKLRVLCSTGDNYLTKMQLSTLVVKRPIPVTSLLGMNVVPLG